MLETILGGLFGGLFRLAPEVMKWLDRKDERKHELSMFDKQLDADRLRSQLKIDEIETQGHIMLDAAGLQALQEGIKAQGVMTGIGWIDGLTQSVRPLVTYIFVALYGSAKAASAVMMYQSGADPVEIFKAIYTESDMALFSGIMNFWYLGRVFDRMR
jgi:hypothetical protein